jgi:hypothetical protein
MTDLLETMLQTELRTWRKDRQTLHVPSVEQRFDGQLLI